ncbi:MAG TPA: hypothetical protein VJK03_01725 [Candidatus Nanoarchaeia archaeon]|nr:hypothetical protein [Candidatus Nanoarchaeia archaeon]
MKKAEYSKIIEFNNHKTGLYDINTFVKDWGSQPRRGVAEGRCRIVKKKGKKVLEITIPKGTESDGGSFWRLNFPKDLEDVTFEYDIMFGDNFDFVRGGKLPGLGGGTSKGSGGTPKEYQNGFSARLMWREIDFDKELLITKSFRKKMKILKEIIKSNESAEKRKEMFDNLKLGNENSKIGWLLRDLVKEPHRAYLVQYMYYPDRKTNAGDDQIYRYKNEKVFVEPNKWYNIKMRIKLSETPKEKDTLLAWVNGKQVLSRKLNLRKNKSYGINQVMFSLFFGGNDKTWHTKKDEKVYFRKFVIKGK